LQLDPAEKKQRVLAEYTTSADVFTDEDYKRTEDDLLQEKKAKYKLVTGLSEADITDIISLMYKGHTRRDWLYKLGWLENVVHERIAHPCMYHNSHPTPTFVTLHT